ncbi:hypothetical protein MCHIJ_14470 [Mycolicibacterium chitae]|nr:hypothetical protein MCHIJ_14470 [Mycolicibacterium chitae]
MASNKRRRHTPDQIIRKLAEGNKLLGSGQELAEVCRHLEIAESTWHRWVAQYGGMKANEAKRLKELEAENARLKKLVANQALDIDMLKEISAETLTPNRKRSAVAALRERFGVSERRACTVVGIHRSTMRLTPAPVTTEEAELRAWLRKFSTDRPRWGWRRAAKMARRAGWQVNNKRIRRLWRPEGLRVPQRRRKSVSPVSASPSARCHRSAPTSSGRWTSSSTPPPMAAPSRCSTSSTSSPAKHSRSRSTAPSTPTASSTCWIAWR